MKLNKFAYLYPKPLGNHTFKVMKKIPGNLLKKPVKNHGNIMEFCQSEKVGTLLSDLQTSVTCLRFIYTERKRIFSLIFITAQCEHKIGFSMNLSRSGETLWVCSRVTKWARYFYSTLKNSPFFSLALCQWWRAEWVHNPICQLSIDTMLNWITDRFLK